MVPEKIPSLLLLQSEGWKDYELLDSGEGQKLERFGSFKIVRPEVQAIWHKALSSSQWEKADAIFHADSTEGGGFWEFRRPIQTPWKMSYQDIKFYCRLSASKHVGFFPEQAAQWNWIRRVIQSGGQDYKILNLFGYTGLASIAAARAGARVTHVDASKKSIQSAKDNLALSDMSGESIRWIIDDSLKFVSREVRRNSHYDGIILDPPKFGRGPKGEVWDFFSLLPELLEQCRLLLGSQGVFIVVTAYAIRASALSLYNALEGLFSDVGGGLTEAGELVNVESSAGRKLSMAIFARWIRQNKS